MSYTPQDFVEIILRRPKSEKEKISEKMQRGPHFQGSAENKIEQNCNEGNLEVTRVSKSLRVAISQGRTAKKMSQSDLARAINTNAKVIQEYENGKAIPDAQVLQKLRRVLGCQLKS